MIKNDMISHLIGLSVFIGGDWTRSGRYIRHWNYDGLLFRYRRLGGNLVKITSVVE